MKTITKIILTLFLLWTMVYGLRTANAAVPHLINYQGRLTDSSGNPLNGSYNLTFRIYDAQSAGNLLWEETHSGALIQKGIFSVLLGSVTSLNLPFDKPYFLEIKVNTEVMSPRQRIASVGYALRAEKAENAINSDNLANKPPSYYLTHANLSGLTGNDHPQYLRGPGNNYKIDSGTVSVPDDSSVAVSFNFTFASPPVVAICFGTDPNTNSAVAVAKDITATGFNAYNATASSGTHTLRWIAIGPAN